jgi:hypothetical protein
METQSETMKLLDKQVSKNDFFGDGELLANSSFVKEARNGNQCGQQGCQMVSF